MRVPHAAVLAVPFLLTLFASPAQASWIEVLIRHDDYCTVGSLRACVSVHAHSITTEDGTEVFFSVRNLQGTNPTDNTGGSAIWHMVVTPLDVPFGTPTTTSYGPSGTVEVLGSPKLESLGATDLGIFLGEDLDQAGIFGCDVPGPVDPSMFGYAGYWVGGWRTCPGDGYHGWFTWSFSSSSRFTVLDLSYSVRLVTAPWGDGQQQFLGCSFSGMESDCVRSVPEPHAFLLGITGLLGIVWALRRRRLDVDLAEDGP